MQSQVAMYVQMKYAKGNKKKNGRVAYEHRIFPGAELMLNELTLNNIKYDYCSMYNVNKYRLILISITSQCDWFSFCRERQKWPRGDYRVIAGGFGVLNYKPFVSMVDYFYFGRSENDIAECISEYLNNGDIGDRPHLLDIRNIKTKYYIRQVNAPYCRPYRLANGLSFTEGTIGCQYKCLFCSYSWQRKHIGGNQNDSGAFNDVQEKTILDIIKGDRENLHALRIVGLDGISQRLRFRVNKKITNDNVTEMLSIVSAHSKPQLLKLYNICGYWDETEAEYSEITTAIKNADPHMESGIWYIVLLNTHFRPMPATPLSHMPSKYIDCSKNIDRWLQRASGQFYPNNWFYKGKNIYANRTLNMESLPQVIMDMIVLRGTESDGDRYIQLSANKKYNNLSALGKQKTLERYFNVGKLFGAYKYGTLPTEYLNTYVDTYKIGRGLGFIK